MALIALLIFVALFALIAPLLVMWTGAADAGSRKQIAAALETAIGPAAVPAMAPSISFRKSEIFSAIPWLNRWLERSSVIPRLRRLIQQAQMKVTPGALLLMSIGSFCVPAYLIDLRTGSLLVSALAGLPLGLLPVGYVMFKRRQRFSKFEQSLPDALDLMVSALRVGHSFSAAMGLVTRECPDPVGSEFKIAFDEQNFGLELRAALENLIERVPLQDLRITVTAILIQRESGGNLAEVLEKTANVIRQRFRLKKQVMVHTAQGRLTGWILTLLPLALGVGLYIVNPDTMSLLWKREIGIKLMYGAGGMLVLGTLIIQKIVRMEV